VALEDLMPLGDLLDRAGRMAGELAEDLGGTLAPVEDQLPDELTATTDNLFRELGRQLGPDPFGSADPVLLDHDDPILHVANRAAHGPTPALVQEIRAIGGPEQWLRRQLHPGQIDDSDAEDRLAAFRQLGRTARHLHDDPTVDPTLVVHELRAATLLRAVWSRRQLLEIMTGFWSDHLSVAMEIGSVVWHKAWEDLHVIRPRALGSFESLLLADAASPAMLLYLDQATSRAPDVNENYARELLELHTVGLGSGFDEEDVRNAAFALAGWTFDWNTWSFTFRDEWHDPRPLRVLDWQHHGGTGVSRGQSLLRHLAQHPATAQRIASKLAIRFVSEAPTKELVDRLASAYMANHSAVRPVLETLFASVEFWESRGARLRRPTEQYAAWLRGLHPRIDIRRGGRSESVPQLNLSLQRLKQPPFGWPFPDGYPEHSAFWSSPALLAERWSAASQLVANGLPGVEVDLLRMVADTTTVDEAIDAMAARMTSRRPSADERDVLQTFAGGGQRRVSELDPAELVHLAHLVLVLPAVQWR